MAVFKFNSETQDRPTLPSIHTLNLPLLSRHTHSNVKYENHDNLLCPPSHAPHNYQHGRQVSSSSSRTSASGTDSRSPSPSDTDSDSPNTTPTKFRLVPCPLEIADAVILVPPPNTPQVPHPNYSPRQGNGQGLLLIGAALQHVRQPHRQLAKGARIHPYRVVRGESTTSSSRRSSIISVTSFSNTV